MAAEGRVPGADLAPLRAVAQAAGADGGALIDRVSRLIEQTRSFVAAQTNAALTLRNWYIGQMVHVEVLGEQRAAYGSKIGATLSHQLSWSHFRLLLRVGNPEAREFHIEQATASRLSVRALEELIGRQGYERKAFERREIADSQIPEGSAVPLDAFRDPVLLDMLGLADTHLERDLESALIHDMEAFLLEVGRGSTLVGGAGADRSQAAHRSGGRRH